MGWVVLFVFAFLVAGFRLRLELSRLIVRRSELDRSEYGDGILGRLYCVEPNPRRDRFTKGWLTNSLVLFVIAVPVVVAVMGDYDAVGKFVLVGVTSVPVMIGYSLALAGGRRVLSRHH